MLHRNEDAPICAAAGFRRAVNYRHAYHAGSFGDVVKHAALALAIESLKRKPQPFVLIDTHAGIGRYDLSAAEPGRTREYETGIARVLAAPDPPAALRPYLDAVARANRGLAGLRWYPGSPKLARALMRPVDRLVLAELHPEDAQALRRAFAGDTRVEVRAEDGWAALRAMLPPPERRGLVLIDPPFEARDEFARVQRGLRASHRRWATGVYLVWYPIKHCAPVDAFHAGLAGSGMRRILVAELRRRAADDPGRLNGCGLAIVNPPWQLGERLGEALRALVPLFADGAGAQSRIVELVPE